MKRREFLAFLGFGAGALVLLPELSAAPALDICTDYPVPYFTGFKSMYAEMRLGGQFLWNVLYEDEKGKTCLVHWCQNVTLDSDRLERIPTGKLLWMQGHGHSAKRITEPSPRILELQKGREINGEIPFEQWQPDDVWPIHQSRLTEKSIQYVKVALSMGFTHYVHLVDGIIEKAHRGLAEDPEFSVVSDNPDYDPNHLVTHDPSEFLDEDGDPLPNYCHRCSRTTSRHADVPIRRFRLINAWKLNRSASTARSDYSDMWDAEQPKLEPIRLDSLIEELANQFADKEVLV